MVRLMVANIFLCAAVAVAQAPCPTQPRANYYSVPSTYSYAAPAYYYPPTTYYYSPPPVVTTPPPPTFSNDSRLRASFVFTTIPQSARLFVDGEELGAAFRQPGGRLAFWTQDLSRTAVAQVRLYINVEGHRLDVTRSVEYGPGTSVILDARDFGLYAPTPVVTPPPPLTLRSDDGLTRTSSSVYSHSSGTSGATGATVTTQSTQTAPAPGAPVVTVTRTPAP